ncbi:9909_t:CDS:2, partial [Funneliformis geosporum]
VTNEQVIYVYLKNKLGLILNATIVIHMQFPIGSTMNLIKLKEYEDFKKVQKDTNPTFPISEADFVLYDWLISYCNSMVDQVKKKMHTDHEATNASQDYERNSGASSASNTCPNTTISSLVYQNTTVSSPAYPNTTVSPLSNPNTIISSLVYQNTTVSSPAHPNTTVSPLLNPNTISSLAYQNTTVSSRAYQNTMVSHPEHQNTTVSSSAHPNTTVLSPTTILETNISVITETAINAFDTPQGETSLQKTKSRKRSKDDNGKMV